jgi:mannan endo-1,4-beta-mannosidase
MNVWGIGVASSFTARPSSGSHDGTVTYTDTSHDDVTIGFTGTQIKLCVAERCNRGSAAVLIDGGPETNVDECAAQDAGDVLVYTSPTLAAGTHTLKVRNTGNRDTSSSGARVDVDRVDILS